MESRMKLQNLRTKILGKKPLPSNIYEGEIAVNYAAGGETLMIKNSENEIVEFGDKKFVEDNYYNKSTIDKKITDKQDAITDLESIRQGAAKGATALQSYTEQYKGTVTGVKINGETKNPSSGVVVLGYINKQLSTSTSSSMALSPNIYYRNTSTALSTLTITLDSVSNNNIINEYFVEFTTSSSGTTVSLPSTIKWANGEIPTFEASTTYQISIVNNLGVVTKFE